MIRQTQPLCFILENVDSLESGVSSSNDDDKEQLGHGLWISDL